MRESSFHFGEQSAGYHSKERLILPAPEGQPQYAKEVTTDLSAGYPPGTSEDEVLAKWAGELQESLCDVVERQRERMKARAAKAKGARRA